MNISLINISPLDIRNHFSLVKKTTLRMREMQAKPNGKYETKTKKIRFLLASHQFIFVPESIAVRKDHKRANKIETCCNEKSLT